MRQFVAAERDQPCKAIEVAANTKAAITGKIMGAVEDRQPCQLDRQIVAALDRPIQGDAAPGIVRSEGLEYPAVGIETKAFGNLAPRPAEGGCYMGADQIAEFLAVEQKAAVPDHPPQKAQRQPTRM